LANLWEFPCATQAPNEAPDECCRRSVREELGVDIEVVASVISFEHAYSHFSVTVHAFYSRYRCGAPTPKTYADFRWVKVSDLSRYAFPKTSKILVDALQSQSKKGTQLDLFHPQRI
jgi:A/G-specific adenine glycosylase